jgi:hypothetical protein
MQDANARAEIQAKTGPIGQISPACHSVNSRDTGKSFIVDLQANIIATSGDYKYSTGNSLPQRT